MAGLKALPFAFVLDFFSDVSFFFENGFLGQSIELYVAVAAHKPA